MIYISPIQFEPEIMFRYINLFSECFPAAGKFNLNYLEWLYKCNPCGKAIGFDAWDEDKLVAHYVVAPAIVRIDGSNMRALLSLNTATHPLYQGRGLFIKLAERTYASAADQGYQAVFGVANLNSTPGFVRKLGFQLVEPLEAKIGLGPLGIDFERLAEQAQFHTYWTKESLQWRCENPNNPVALRQKDERLQLYVPAIGVGLPAYAEEAVQKGIKFEYSKHVRQPLLSPVRLYLGLSPAGCKRTYSYVDIPKRFRPSPLNFIYKTLGVAPQKLNSGQVSFSFLDFDAY